VSYKRAYQAFLRFGEISALGQQAAQLCTETMKGLGTSLGWRSNQRSKYKREIKNGKNLQSHGTTNAN